MATETKRATGTITAGEDGTVFTVTMDDSFSLSTNSEVGRILYLTGNNNAQGRYRNITANTATTITVDAPFGGGPFRALTPTVAADASVGDATDELAAVANQTFAISKTLAECNSSDVQSVTHSDLVLDVYVQEISSTWVIPADVVVYDEDVAFNMFYNSSSGPIRLDIQAGGALILGKQNIGDHTDDTINGYPSNGCLLSDRTSGLSDSVTLRGALHLNGCHFYESSSNTGALFWRFLNEPSFRMWGCNAGGNFGGRWNGRYTVIYDNVVAENQSTVGPFGPLAVAVFEGNTVRSSRYAYYNYPQNAGSSTVGALAVQDIDVGVVFANISGGADPETTQIINWSLTQIDNTTRDLDCDIINISGGGDADQLYQFRHDYKLDFTNSDGSNPTDNAAVLFIDDLDNELTATSDGGSVPAQRLTSYEITVDGDATSVPDFDDSRWVKYTDYTWAVKYRNHNLLSNNTDLDEPVIGQINESFPRLVDTLIDTDDTTIVDAYTDLGTATRIYDFADKFKYDNMAFPSLTTQWVTRSGSTIQTNSDIPIKFDSSQSDVMSHDTDFQIDFGGQDIGVGANQDVNSWALRSGPDADDGLVSNQNVWSSWAGQYLHLRAPNGSDDNHFGLFNYLQQAQDPTGIDHIDISFTSDGDDGTATFSISNQTEVTTLDSEKTLVVRLNLLQESTGTPPGSGATSAAMRIDCSMMRFLQVKTPAAGYVGGVTAPTVEFDTEIQGDVTASYIHHNFTDGDTIISSGTISGVMFLPAGNFTISGGDIAGASFYRQDGETGDVVIIVDPSVTGTGDATLGADVEYQNSLTVTLVGADTTDGRLDYFPASLALDSFHNVTGSDLGSDIELNSTDHPELATDAEITLVYSGGTAKDHRETVTIASGSNEVTINLSSQTYPAAAAQSVLDEFDESFINTYLYSSDVLTIVIDKSGSGPTFTAGTFNNWLHTFIRGQEQYNALVRDHGTDLDGSNAIDSLGSTNPASVNGTYVKFTPSGNADISVGYVQDNSDGEVGVTTARSVTATIAGESESSTFNFNVVIGEETAFDTQTTGATLAGFVDDSLDERGVITQNMHNIAVVNKVFVDANGNKQYAPDNS